MEVLDVVVVVKDDDEADDRAEVVEVNTAGDTRGAATEVMMATAAMVKTTQRRLR